jgi:hypothetical protein
MRGKATAVFLATMFASQVALTAMSFAKGNNSSTTTNFKAKLAPPVGSPSECEGGAKYTKKVNNTTLATVESFTGAVECPILLTDLVTAQGDVYEMDLFHAADLVNPYAVCTLVIKEFDFEYESDPLVPAGAEGEYAVSVGQKSPPTPPTVTTKVGGCTIIATGLPGVPAVVGGATGDTANVFLQSNPSTLLLTGKFVVSSGD